MKKIVLLCKKTSLRAFPVTANVLFASCVIICIQLFVPSQQCYLDIFSLETRKIVRIIRCPTSLPHHRQKYPEKMKPCRSSSLLEPMSKCSLKTFFFIRCTVAPSVTPTAVVTGVPTPTERTPDAEQHWVKDRKKLYKLQ